MSLFTKKRNRLSERENKLMVIKGDSKGWGERQMRNWGLRATHYYI